MGINVSLLKQRLEEEKISPDQLAKKIGIDRATFYRKLKAGGVKFTVGEVQKMIPALNLSAADAIRIFFTETVA